MNKTLFSEIDIAALQSLNASRAFFASFQNKCRHFLDITPFMGISYSLVAVMGLLGNLSLIYVICRQKQKGNVTYVLIANLAFSDLLVCIFSLPFTIVYTVMDYWIFGLGLCKIINFVMCASFTVSPLILVLIAFERYQLILHPTGWKPSVPQAYIAVLIVWCLASLVALPLVFSMVLTGISHTNISKVFDFLADKQLCKESWASEQQRMAYTITLLLLQYIIPLCIILGCYFHISLHLQRRGALFRRRDTHMRRVNLMLASMVGAFAICWLPLNIFNSITELDLLPISVCYHDLIFSLCHLLAMISICINPVIYGLLNNNVKSEFKLLVQSCTGRKKKFSQVLENLESHPLSITAGSPRTYYKEEGC
ncbi:neuropeptide Y receptor type 4-2-like [Bombina bombina]|uniref:neuropeptide Y receptor type 4-2-like n=1 Tax=Bombina bombina TaxID=8345 RepID=UPI00235AF3C0|nr:neuropeptide Y receptor type 4-2-like [Bombina bombina]